MKKLDKLVHVTGTEPGIRRLKHGNGFSYEYDNGKPVKQQALLKHIEALVIPPAYERVWISPDRNAHILATGFDAKGRKQYLYHPYFIECSNTSKFKKLKRFGKCLPAIREHVAHDLLKREWTREKVLALTVKFLDEFYIRIGNKAYEVANGSFGLTTLKKKHLSAQEGGKLRFEFKAKSGKMKTITIQNKRLARLVSSISELPGQEIFKFFDKDKARHPIKAADVNGYLQEISGQKISAKDFRTWKATVLAIEMWPQVEATALEKRKKGGAAAIPALVKQVAESMGNTVAVCRQYYIHPAVLKSIEGNKLAASTKRIKDVRPYFTEAEEVAMRLIR